MLETLDTVDWANLEHAYGAASDVPSLLRALASSDTKTRDSAQYYLYGNIFHQGTRYEATAYAVPFLFELVENPQVIGRDKIILLLTHLALGYPEEYLPHGIDPDTTFVIPDATETVSECDCDNEEDWDTGDYAAWFRNAYAAVEAGVGLFLQCAVKDTDPKVRRAAVYALGWFPRRAKVSVPAVREIARHGDDPLLRVNALLTLGLLNRSQNASGDTDLFLELLEDAVPATVRFAAAIALGETLGDDIPTFVLTVLQEAVGWETPPDQEDWDWAGDELSGYATMLLSVIGHRERERVVSALLEGLQQASPRRSLAVTQAILDLILRTEPEGPITIPAYPTLLQGEALTAIAEWGAWRIGDTHFASYGELFRAYGLPNTPETLRAFVSA